MLKLSHAMLALISGAIWMAVGCFLLPLGLKLLLATTPGQVKSFPLIDALAPYFGGTQQVALLLVVLGLLIGYLKGRHVLGKAASKGITRIKSLPNPASLAKIYSAKYYLLLGGMVLLGMSIKFFGVPDDIRGFVDVAVGSALIQGAMVYIRYAVMNWQKVSI